MNNVETALIKVDGLLLAEQNQLGSSGVGAAIYIDNTSTKLEKRTLAELENEKLRLEVRKWQLKVEKFELEEEIREWNQQLQTEGDSFDSTALLGKLRVESDEKSEKIKELDEIINRIGDAVSKVLDQAKEVVQVVLPRVEKQFKRSLHDLEEGVHNLEGHIRKFF